MLWLTRSPVAASSATHQPPGANTAPCPALALLPSPAPLCTPGSCVQQNENQQELPPHGPTAPKCSQEYLFHLFLFLHYESAKSIEIFTWSGIFLSQVRTLMIEHVSKTTPKSLQKRSEVLLAFCTALLCGNGRGQPSSNPMGQRRDLSPEQKPPWKRVLTLL